MKKKIPKPAGQEVNDRRDALDNSWRWGIVQKYGDLVRRWLLTRYPWLKDSVDDILWDAVDRLWKKRDKYDENIGTQRSWFFSEARYAAKDAMRAEFKEQLALSEFGHVLLKASSNPESETPVDRPPPIVADLLEIVNGLTQDEQNILFTWAHWKFSGEKNWAGHLAKELKTTPGALRTRLSRLKTFLVEELHHRGHEVPKCKSKETE